MLLDALGSFLLVGLAYTRAAPGLLRTVLVRGRRMLVVRLVVRRRHQDEQPEPVARIVMAAGRPIMFALMRVLVRNVAIRQRPDDPFVARRADPGEADGTTAPLELLEDGQDLGERAIRRLRLWPRPSRPFVSHAVF